MRALCLDGPLKGKFISSEYNTFLYAEPNEDKASMLDVGNPIGPLRKIEDHECVYKLSQWATQGEEGRVYHKFWTTKSEYCPIASMLEIISEANNEL